jgi:hypothetical protein
MSGDAAFMLAFFSFGYGLLAAGFFSRERGGSQKSYCPDADNQSLNCFHIRYLSLNYAVAFSFTNFFAKATITRPALQKKLTQADFTATGPNVYRVFGDR